MPPPPVSLDHDSLARRENVPTLKPEKMTDTLNYYYAGGEGGFDITKLRTIADHKLELAVLVPISKGVFKKHRASTKKVKELTEKVLGLENQVSSLQAALVERVSVSSMKAFETHLQAKVITAEMCRALLFVYAFPLLMVSFALGLHPLLNLSSALLLRLLASFSRLLLVDPPLGGPKLFQCSNLH